MKTGTIITIVSIVTLGTIYIIGKTQANKRGYANTVFGATIYGVPLK